MVYQLFTNLGAPVEGFVEEVMMNNIDIIQHSHRIDNLENVKTISFQNREEDGDVEYFQTRENNVAALRGIADRVALNYQGQGQGQGMGPGMGPG
jgi:hypothetical protein